MFRALYFWLLSWIGNGTSAIVAPLAHGRRWVGPQGREQDTAPITDYNAWVEALSKRLHLPQPFTPEEVVACVEGYLGCTIRLMLRDWEGSQLYGACVEIGPKQFVIALRHDMSKRQRAKTIYHELAHILRGHELVLEGQFRYFEPTTPQDIEAEEIARVLREIGTRGRRKPFLERFTERMGGVD